MRVTATCLLILVVLGCQSASKTNTLSEAQPVTSKILNLEFLGDQILPANFPLSDTEVGGLSGLEWSEQEQVLYAISDDRGWKGPSRFYRLAFRNSIETTPALEIVEEVSIKQNNGKVFPKRSMDTEGISLHPDGSVLVSTEGDFEKTKSAVPGIFQLQQDGRLKAFHKIGPPVFPEDENWQEGVYGVRANMSLESLSYSGSVGRMVTATENALVQDDLAAGASHGANTRFYIFDYKKVFPGRLVAQHVYPISRVPSQNAGDGAKIGVTDLIIVSKDKYLVLERSYLKGRSKNRVQLFYADCEEATNVNAFDSLKNKEFTRCSKQLVYDFDVLLGRLSEKHPRVDNLEGMTFGPQLSDGSRLLIFVSDNNFSSKQATQFLFFKARLTNL